MQGLDENEHIFISYKSASDGGGTIGREFAEKLKDAFEEQLCIECFIDTASIHSGDNWLQKLRQAVGRAKAVICLVSDVYMNSDWCSYEFMIARQDQKAFPFSVQSDFNPANYADLHINQIPSILHWDGKITHPLLENEIPNIARKLERPIEGLLSAIRAEDVYAIAKWCDSYKEDPASQYWLRRLIRAEIDARDENNRNALSQLKIVKDKQFHDTDAALTRERNMLLELSKRSRDGDYFSYEDFHKLRDLDPVDPETFDQEKQSLRAERQENKNEIRRLRNVVESREEELAKLRDDLEKSLTREAQKQSAIDELEQELERIRSIELDFVEQMMRQNNLSTSVSRTLKRAYDLSRQAIGARKDAESLKRIIQARAKAEDGERKDSASYSRFSTELDNSEHGTHGSMIKLKSPPRDGRIYLERAYGIVGDDGALNELGVLEFAVDGETFATFYGQISGYFPASTGVGELSFGRGFDHSIVKFSGSWTEGLAFGCLRRPNGHYYGQVSLSRVFEIYEQGEGVFDPDDRSLSAMHGPWETGVFRGHSVQMAH